MNKYSGNTNDLMRFFMCFSSQLKNLITNSWNHLLKAVYSFSMYCVVKMLDRNGKITKLFLEKLFEKFEKSKQNEYKDLYLRPQVLIDLLNLPFKIKVGLVKSLYLSDICDILFGTAWKLRISEVDILIESSKSDGNGRNYQQEQLDKNIKSFFRRLIQAVIKFFFATVIKNIEIIIENKGIELNIVFDKTHKIKIETKDLRASLNLRTMVESEETEKPKPKFEAKFILKSFTFDTGLPIGQLSFKEAEGNVEYFEAWQEFKYNVCTHLPTIKIPKDSTESSDEIVLNFGKLSLKNETGVDSMDESQASKVVYDQNEVKLEKVHLFLRKKGIEKKILEGKEFMLHINRIMGLQTSKRSEVCKTPDKISFNILSLSAFREMLSIFISALAENSDATVPKDFYKLFVYPKTTSEEDFREFCFTNSLKEVSALSSNATSVLEQSKQNEKITINPVNVNINIILENGVIQVSNWIEYLKISNWSTMLESKVKMLVEASYVDKTPLLRNASTKKLKVFHSGKENSPLVIDIEARKNPSGKTSQDPEWSIKIKAQEKLDLTIYESFLCEPKNNEDLKTFSFVNLTNIVIDCKNEADEQTLLPNGCPTIFNTKENKFRMGYQGYWSKVYALNPGSEHRIKIKTAERKYVLMAGVSFSSSSMRVELSPAIQIVNLTKYNLMYQLVSECNCFKEEEVKDLLPDLKYAVWTCYHHPNEPKVVVRNNDGFAFHPVPLTPFSALIDTINHRGNNFLFFECVTINRKTKLLIYPYVFGLAPWEIYNLHSESLNYGQRSTTLHTLGSDKKILYNWENPLKDQILVLKKGLWKTEINLKLTDSIKKAKWTKANSIHINGTNIYWLTKVLNNQRSVIITGDKELLKRLTEYDNPLTVVSLDLEGLGLSIVNEENKKKITYYEIFRPYFSYKISKHNLREFKFKANAMKIRNEIEGRYYPVLLDQKRKETNDAFVNLSGKYRVQPNAISDIDFFMHIKDCEICLDSTLEKFLKQTEELREKSWKTINWFELTSSKPEPGEQSYIKKFEIDCFTCKVSYTKNIKGAKICIPRFKIENEFYRNLTEIENEIWDHYKRKKNPIAAKMFGGFVLTSLKRLNRYFSNCICPLNAY